MVGYTALRTTGYGKATKMCVINRDSRRKGCSVELEGCKIARKAPQDDHGTLVFGPCKKGVADKAGLKDFRGKHANPLHNTQSWSV
jgi:hypothetical protein